MTIKVKNGDIELKVGERISYNVNLSGFIDALDFTIADIDSIIFWAKENKTDSTPVVRKAIGDGLVMDGSSVKISFLSGDYGAGSFQGNNSYPYAIEITWNSNQSKEIELGRIKVKDDFIKE